MIVFLILILFCTKSENFTQTNLTQMPPGGTVLSSGTYKLPPSLKSIYAFGGGGGGAAVNAGTGHIHPGGGGGSGFAAAIPIIQNPYPTYMYVLLGNGGTSDLVGGTTIVKMLDPNMNTIQTILAPGGQPGQQGGKSIWDVPYGGNGGAGYCGGGGGGIGYFTTNQPSKSGSGGAGVLPQNNGADGGLLDSDLPIGGKGGCGGGDGGQAFFKLGGGGGGGGTGGGHGAADGSEGNIGGNASGRSAGGGGAAFGEHATSYILAGGTGGDGYVVVT